MKKYVLILILIAAPACAYPPPQAAIMQVHDMEMIKQQRFRMEELNYYNDVQTEKIRYQKRNMQTKPVIQKKFSDNQNQKFVEQNGELKIENY